MTKTEVLAYFGSQAEAARRYGGSDAQVSKWANRLPFEVQCVFEHVTEGRLKARIPRYIDRKTLCAAAVLSRDEDFEAKLGEVVQRGELYREEFDRGVRKKEEHRRKRLKAEALMAMKANQEQN